MNAQTTIKPAMAVYQKIAAVQGALARHGIGKNRTASTGRTSYAFRGIDDVYNALAPLLAEHGLCVLPRMLSREVIERKSSQGNALFYVTVEAEFDFVAAEDGSAHTVRTFGEAMDSGDKATNKAMSAAYKYAAFMAFAIPTEGDNDSENHTYEVAASTMPPEAFAKITTLVQATNSNVPKLLQAIGVTYTDQLTGLGPDDYNAAVAALETKLAKMAKVDTDAKAREVA